MVFKKNDIVRLRQKYFDEIQSVLHLPQNVFFVESEDDDCVLLRNIKVPIPSTEVYPVRINGVEDVDIYYDPVLAADIISSDATLKPHHIDKNKYYLQKLQECFDPKGRSLYDVLKQKHYTYVHELQRDQPDIGRCLKINYKTSSFVKSLPSKVKLGAISTVMTYKKYLDTQHQWESCVKVYVDRVFTLSKMLATSVPSSQTAYVLLFKDNNYFEARYAQFYINSSIAKLFLQKGIIKSKLEGRVTLVSLKSLVVRCIDAYKESSVYLESLIQVVHVFEERFGKKYPVLSGLSGFLDQLRNAMVMEMLMPQLFHRANFSVLKTWKRDTDGIMLDLYLDGRSPKSQIEVINKLIGAMGSDQSGIVNEMNKYRVYMLEFFRFAEENKSEL